MLIAGLLTLCGSGSLTAAENKYDQNQAEAIESSLFIEADEAVVSNSAKLANFLSSDNDVQAKCWFSGWRSYYYPCNYYYYNWYCNWYYVPFRIVYYTVPVQPVVAVTQAVTTSYVNYTYTYPTAVTTTAAVTTAPGAVVANSTTIIAKSSKQVACGAVIDQKVTSNSPLFKMGLRAGDIIAKIDGKPVKSMIDIRRMTGNSKVVFIRGNQIKVAGKQLLTKTNNQISKANGNPVNIDLNILKANSKKEMSLYEYYDSLDK